MRPTKKQAQTQDRARRAVTEFRKLQPTLTAYARNLTGKRDVRVEMSATDNGSTDGTKIYFKPPIRLGDMATTRHEKSLCDKRDPDSLELYCWACQMREQILAIIYHEIAHIAFDSFAAVTMADAKFALQIVKALSPAWYYERMAEKFVKDPNILRGKKTFTELAQAINPYFKLMVNALEDVRINERMADARPGTRIMQDAKMLQIANNGVEQKDAEGKTVWVYWNEYPTNHQACLAALVTASGYGDMIDGWFEERVVEAVRDPEMVALLDEVQGLTGAQQVFEHSFKVYRKFRDLGFFMLKDEEPPPAEPEPEENDNAAADEAADGEDGGAGEGDSDDDGADGSGESDAPDTGDDSSDSGASGGGEGSGSESDSDRGGSEDHDGDESSRDGSSSRDRSGLGSDGEGEPGADGSAGGAPDDDDRGESEDDERDQSSEDGGESDRVDDDADPTRDEAQDSDGVGEGSGDQPGDDGDDAESESPESGDDSEGESGSDLHGGPDADTDAPGESDGDGEGDSDRPESGERESDDTDSAGDAAGSDEGASEGLHPEDGDAEAGRTSDADAVDEGGDPLDYKPEAESAIDLTDNEPVKPVEPTIGSDDKVELIDLGLHPEADEVGDVSPEMDKAIDTAIIQSVYFEMPSQNIAGLNVWKYDNYQDDAANRPWHAWGGDRYSGSYASHRGQTIDPVGESVLGPALMKLRVVFSDNKRSHRNRNMRSGKIDTRALGKRGWSGDDRLFGRKVVPNRKDYFVAIFLDVSGSTRGVNLKMIKEAALAQAELCFRMGVAFAVYAHTGSPRNLTDYSDGLDVDLYEVKAPEQAWDNKARQALMELNPSAANLDGHTMEFARKLADAQPQTNKVILYYSDGAMPLENHDEELEILRREISTCKAKGYTLLGVGVRTDSPARHGLETVQIDDSGEVAKVVAHLERHLVS